ncbi:hypothetical protein [Shewanella youngdeokensis]|uniref:Uncharacterized protein n=1 Tax=Shewanella youngdeokensis TaxID=2999068 RepID=A0ABZ0K3F7_9GAMM|nr:hypothetical protein RGE70_07015 [Shewanella sp. DAU334]
MAAFLCLYRCKQNVISASHIKLNLHFNEQSIALVPIDTQSLD